MLHDMLNNTVSIGMETFRLKRSVYCLPVVQAGVEPGKHRCLAVTRSETPRMAFIGVAIVLATVARAGGPATPGGGRKCCMF